MIQLDSPRTKVVMAIALVVLIILQFFIDTTPVQQTSLPPTSRVVNMPIYLRGSMNDWNTSTQFSPNQANDEFTLVYDFDPGSYEFKIADGTWEQVDLGASEPEVILEPAKEVPLTIRGTNIKFVVQEKSTFVFVLGGQTSDAMTLKIFKANIAEKS